MGSSASSLTAENNLHTAAQAARVADSALLAGKTALVTGANTGIGKETARVLALGGARVFVGCRDQAKCDATIADLKKSLGASEAKADLQPAVVDLSSFASIRAFAADFGKRCPSLDILVCNAGVMAAPFSTTADGLETQLGVNHFGHFLLAQLVNKQLRAAPKARVVVLSSSAHHFAPEYGVDVDDLDMSKHGYGAWTAYGRSKLANILFTRELNDREKAAGSNVTAFAVHPGVIATDLSRHLPAWQKYPFILGHFFMKSIPQGAATSLYCAVSDEAIANPGGFFFDSHVQPTTHKLAENKELAVKLWECSEKVVSK